MTNKLKVFSRSFIWTSVTAIALTGCALHQTNSGTDEMAPRIIDEEALGQGVAPGTPIGGAIAASMTPTDREKLNHALDKAIGVSTTWTNGRRDTTYTVTPTRHVTIHGNTLCRQYRLESAYEEQVSRSMTGVACVASDGAWSEVAG